MFETHASLRECTNTLPIDLPNSTVCSGEGLKSIHFCDVSFLAYLLLLSDLYHTDIHLPKSLQDINQPLFVAHSNPNETPFQTQDLDSSRSSGFKQHLPTVIGKHVRHGRLQR